MSSYPLFPERWSQDLNGAWGFTWLGPDTDIEQIDPAAPPHDGLMAVPGVFDTCPDYFGKRGVGVYRRKLSCPAAPGDSLRLKLGGLGLYARIWWDNHEIGRCDLPYSSVAYDFPAGSGTEHVLAIAVDNRFDPVRSPLFSPNFDFYAYGGIYRGVELQLLPACRLERVQVTTLDLATGKVRLRVRLGGDIPAELAFTARFDQGEAMPFRLPTNASELALELDVPDFKVWSPSSPSLHTVTVAIDGDSVVERFGLRRVETRGQEVLVNGEPTRLLGVNRHESHPEFGPVQNTHLMLDDLRLLKDLGCNFVRCVHYPQDQAFLDLCDELGMLVWQESMGWNNTEADVLAPRFHASQIEQTRLMVRNSVNHPSVILWGFMNECCSDTEGGRKLYQAHAQAIKAENPAFLVTYASNKHEKDLCFEFADVMAMTMYPGWFSDITDWTTRTSAWIDAYIKRMAAFVELPEHHGKPFVVAEIGACALYGCHDRANAQWSEEFQADYMAEACRCILGNPRYAGLALWQFFDTRSYVNVGSDVRGKPRGFNCAGLLDEYRRPKLAYDAVRDIYRAHN